MFVIEKLSQNGFVPWPTAWLVSNNLSID
jgi:hypothetical protein